MVNTIVRYQFRPSGPPSRGRREDPLLALRTCRNWRWVVGGEGGLSAVPSSPDLTGSAAWSERGGGRHAACCTCILWGPRPPSSVPLCLSLRFLVSPYKGWPHIQPPRVPPPPHQQGPDLPHHPSQTSAGSTPHRRIFVTASVRGQRRLPLHGGCKPDHFLLLRFFWLDA